MQELFVIIVLVSYEGVRMATRRYAVFIEEHWDGHFTGCLVHDKDLAVFAASLGELRRQFKEALNWLAKQQQLPEALDIVEEQFLQITVALRPDHFVGQKRFPSDKPILLPLRCYVASCADDTQLCFIPKLGISFHFFVKEQLRDLVKHTVQTFFQQATTETILQHMPSKEEMFEHVQIPVRVNRPEKKVPVISEELAQIAERIQARPVQYSRVWQRESHVRTICEALTTRSGANILLVGEPGVGKTAILYEVAMKMRKNHDPRPFWRTSGARIISGMSYLGQWEQRCEKLVEEVSALRGVLAVDDLMGLITAGRIQQEDTGVAGFLLPFITRGDFLLWAETTPAGLTACRQILPGLVDVFKIIRIDETDATTTLQILESLLQQHNKHKINFETEVPALVYKLFARFIPYRYFPGKAVEFLYTLIEQQAPKPQSTVEIEKQHVIEHFLQLTHLPKEILQDNETLNIQRVENFFCQRVVGQKSACEIACHLVYLYKSALNDPNKPVASLLFCGPTGVGKTEMAKALAEYFFGSGSRHQPMVRLDMSEYSTPGSVNRLIGYRNELGVLARRVREQPFSLILLDEIEKASVEIFDVLLSIFGEGRLTDPLGRLIDFRNTIIVMTSNLGVTNQTSSGFRGNLIPDYASTISKFFRPELFNRLDYIVEFQHLSQQTIETIADKEIQSVEQRTGLQRRNIKLTVDKGLLQRIIQQGYVPEYGARPLKRVIEELIVVPVSRYLVKYPNIVNQSLLLTIHPDSSEVRVQLEKRRES